MKSKWKKSKIGSALMALSGKVMFQIVISMVAHCLRLEADAGKWWSYVSHFPSQLPRDASVIIIWYPMRPATRLGYWWEIIALGTVPILWYPVIQGISCVIYIVGYLNQSQQSQDSLAIAWPSPQTVLLWRTSPVYLGLVGAHCWSMSVPRSDRSLLDQSHQC